MQAKGVDSIGVGFANPATFVRNLARKERESQTSCLPRMHVSKFSGCVVALTGAIDWVSDGTTVVKLTNGHRLLGDITGSGCLVGTCIATFCAGAWELAKNEDGAAKLVRGDMLMGAVGGYVRQTFQILKLILQKHISTYHCRGTCRSAIRRTGVGNVPTCTYR